MNIRNMLKFREMGLLQTLKDTFRQNGIREFYRGVGIATVSQIPESPETNQNIIQIMNIFIEIWYNISIIIFPYITHLKKFETA